MSAATARQRVGDLQRALAALLYEPQSRERFERDPDEWLAPWQLAARDAAILRSLDPGRIAYFHELQARDRTYFVESLFPLTLAVVGEGAVRRFFAAFPYGHDDFAVEAERFAFFVHAAWSHDDAMASAARDLAAYEAALAWLRARPPPAERAPPAPEPGARVALSDTARLVPYEHDLPALLAAVDAGEGVPGKGRAGTALLRRLPSGEIVASDLDDADAQTLARLRDPVAVRELKDAVKFRELWEAGVLRVVDA